MSDPSYRLIDMGATLYTNQEVQGNYRDTKVRIRLRQIDRAWWFDRFVSHSLILADNRSFLEYRDVDGNDGDGPAVGVFDVPAADLHQTPLWGSRFHLKPEVKYEVCTWMHKENNVYYRTTNWLDFNVWSDEGCSEFTYAAEAKDDRSGMRKFRDGWTRIFAIFPWW